jgi:hypothetical protein
MSTYSAFASSNSNASASITALFDQTAVSANAPWKAKRPAEYAAAILLSTSF